LISLWYEVLQVLGGTSGRPEQEIRRPAGMVAMTWRTDFSSVNQHIELTAPRGASKAAVQY
jgi:hypothetical protein